MKSSWRVFLPVALATAVFDLATKWLVEASIPRYSRVVIIDGFINLTNVRNPGAAFGIFSEGGFGRVAFFATVAVLAMIFMLWLVKKTSPENILELVSLGLIFGGAAGNLADRLRYGEVVDFILFFWRDYYYPAFNVADSAICVGIALFFWSDFRKKRET